MSKEKAVLPCLSSYGWLNANHNPIQVANQLLAHFFVSDYSQSYTCAGSVSSCAEVVDRHRGKVDDIRRDLRDQLTKYFGRYFSDVKTEVIDVSTNDQARAVVNLSMSFTTADGKIHDLSDSFSLVDGNMNKIMEIQRKSPLGDMIDG